MSERRCNDCESDLSISMVSFDTGIWMCTNKMCNFPLNSSQLENFVEMVKPAEKEGKRSCVSSSQVNKSDEPGKLQKASTWNKEHRTAKTSSSNSTVSSNDENSFCPNYKPQTYPLWQNKKSNLCWLDVTLSLFVTNKHISRNLLDVSYEHVLKQFISKYNACQDTYSIQHDYKAIEETLEKLRHQIWTYLQPDMALSPGQLDSPFFTLQLLFKKVPRLNEMTTCEYQHSFLCKKCGFQKQNWNKTSFLSIPNCIDDFYIPKQIGFLRECFRCKSQGELNSITCEKSSDLIVIHCNSGFKKAKFWQDYFPFQKSDGHTGYFVSHIIQYTGTHYILWSFDLKEQRWLKADDLEDPTCSFLYGEPNFPTHECNIVVWEKLKEIPGLKTENGSTAKLLENLTLINSSLSSSSSSASLGDEGKSSSVISTRPSMMRKWLKKVEAKPVISDWQMESSSKYLQENNLVLSRYKPYVSKRNKTYSVEGSKSLQGNVCEHLEAKDVKISKDLINATSDDAVDIRIEPLNLDAKDGVSTRRTDNTDNLFDSAYSSPITDANAVNNHDIYINENVNPNISSTEESSPRCTFDAAMEMVDRLFQRNSPQDLPLLSPRELPPQESSSNFLGLEIDINQLF